MKNKTNLIIYCSIGVVSTLIIGLLIYASLNSTKTVEMPDFSTATYLDVESWAQENEVTVTYQYEFSEEVPVDAVMSQSIDAETVFKVTDELIVVLSKGIDYEVVVPLPDFKGMTLKEIEEFIAKNHFNDVTYDYVIDEEIPKNTFIKLNTEEKEVKRNTMLVFTISLGKESEQDLVEIELIDFASYTKSQISNWGVANDITIKFVYKSSTTVEEGKLISQSPKAGETILSKSTVTITLSTGKPIAAVNFAGKTKDYVNEWLKENSNKVKVSYKEVYNNEVAKNTVISNSPNSGTLSDGATITVTVSLGKPSVSSYVGKSESSFNTHINSLNNNGANLKITKTEQYSNSVASGNIISQDITGSTSTGSTIKIVVSKGKEPVYVTVESFIGKTENEFKTWVSSKKLTLGTRSTAYTNDAAGTVIAQNPSSGSIVEGTSIAYSVSLGKPNIANFVGQTEDAFRTNINTINASISSSANQIKISSSTAYSSTIPFGSIISQSATGNVNLGTTITIVVSKGKEPVTVTVPNYVGKFKDSIASNDSGLVIEFKAGTYDGKTYGTITAQSVASGSKVSEGTKVILTYSLGTESSKNIKPYDDLYTGQGTPATVKSTIEKELADAGFTNYKVILENNPDGSTQGVVWYQNVHGMITLSTEIIIKIQP